MLGTHNNHLGDAQDRPGRQSRSIASNIEDGADMTRKLYLSNPG